MSDFRVPHSANLWMSYVNGPSLVELHVESTAARVVVALAGHALVGRRRGGAAPRTVEVEAWIGEEGRNERALHSHFQLSARKAKNQSSVI